MTRFYVDTTSVTPPFTPTISVVGDLHGDWDAASSTSMYLNPTRSAIGAAAGSSVAVGSTSSNRDYCRSRMLTDPITVGGVLPAGTEISWAIKGSESNAGMNGFQRIFVAIIAGDTNTLRATITATSQLEGTETTVSPTYRADAGSVTLASNITVQAGDYIYIEWGMRTSSSSTSYTINRWGGANASSGDATDGDTNNNNAAWVQVNGMTGLAVDAAVVVPTGKASSLAFGSPTVSTSTTVSPSGVAPVTALGQPTVVPGAVSISPSGIAPGGGLGSPGVTTSNTVAPVGVAPTGGVGAPAVTTEDAVSPQGIAASSAVGQPTVAPGAVTVSPSGIAPVSAVGQPGVFPVQSVSVSGVGPVSAFGQPGVTTTTDVVVVGVVSAAQFGLPNVATFNDIVATGIGPGSALGEPSLVVTISPDSVAASGGFGEPLVRMMAWRLVQPTRLNGSLLGVRPVPIQVSVPVGLTVYGTSAGLVAKECPSRRDLRNATHVYYGGHEYTSVDPVEIALWESSGFATEEVYV